MPRVLISYRHESEAHRARVLALADRLRADGVDAWIDRYESWVEHGWPKWMEAQITEARWVICVCSEGYRTGGAGVARETGIIDQVIYDAHGKNEKFIPVRFHDAPEAVVPGFLRPYSRHALRDLGEADAGYAGLYRTLIGQPEVVPPELGRVPLAPLRSDGATPGSPVAAERRSPHEVGLRLWLDWLQGHVNVLPSFDEGGERPLAELYVDLHGDTPGGKERRLLVDLVRREPTGRFTVQGDPGSGKSTLLRQLALEVAQQGLAALDGGGGIGPAAVPVLLDLTELAGHAGMVDRVGAICRERFARMYPRQAQSIADALADALDSGRVLLLLDGLDEVDPKHRPQLLRDVGELARTHARCGVVLTSRRDGYVRPDTRFRELEILPLDPEEQRILFEKLGTPDVEARLAEIASVPSLQDLARNPLTLTLLARLAAEPGPLPRRRTRVFQRVLDLALGPRTLSQLPQVDPGQARVALGRLALRLPDGQGGPWTTTELTDAAGGEDVVDLARRSRVLVPVDRERWRFHHRSLMECLAAEELARRGWEAHVEGLAGGVWYKPWTLRAPAKIGRWAEVYAMVAGLAPDPPKAIQALARSHPELARRAAVATAELPIDALLAAFKVGGGGALALVRELMQRVPDRETLGVVLERLAEERPDRDTRCHVAAALLVTEQMEALARVQRRAGGGVEVGVPERPWVDVPAGEFWMGSQKGEGYPDEHPRHRVRITRGLRVLATPVTQAMYAVVVGKNPAHFTGDPRRPVEQVSWSDAVAWCGALSRLQRRPAAYAGETVDLGVEGWCLPTEAEWEYTCRAGTETPWSCEEEELADHAWFSENAAGTTHPVGEKKPNPWGLYDLHGNVWEWCADAWRREYTKQPIDDPFLPSAPGGGRVIRGGSWLNAALWCRSGYRNWLDPVNRGGNLGFRVVLPLLRAGS